MDLTDKEKIISLLQEAVLSFCQKNYNSSVEVDGIICITSLCSTDQHVVKIHETLNPYHSNALYNSNHEEMTLDLHVQEEDTPSVLQKNVNTSGKRRKGRTKLQEVLQNNTRKNIKDHSALDRNEESVNNVEKYPYLMQTLCNAHVDLGRSNQEKSRLESEDSNNSEHLSGRNSREVTPVSEPDQHLINNTVVSEDDTVTSNTNEHSEKFNRFWKAVVKKRLKSKVSKGTKQEVEAPKPGIDQVVTKDLMDTIIDTHMDPNQGTSQTHLNQDAGHQPTNNSDNSFDYSLNICSNLNNNEAKISEDKDNTSYCSNAEDLNGVGRTYTTTVQPEGMFIKQEPVWEDDYQASPSSQSMSNDGYHDNLSNATMEISSTFDEQNIKKEPDVCDSTNDAGNKDNQPDVANKNSILLKILKGKSLKEAYRNTNQPGIGTMSQGASSYGASSMTSTQESSDKRDNPSDQDNSLLYRLPFVSFQDLFSSPQNSAPFPPMDTSNSVRLHKPPNPTNKTAFETLARTLLQSNDNSSRSKRSNSRQISIADYEYGSEVDSLEEDLSMEDDPHDSPYIPYKDDDPEPHTPPRKMRKRKVKKTNVKSSGGSAQKRKKAEYTCGLCGQKFESIGERNRHEERELEERGMDQPEFVKCPLCNGFFADEESKNKHLEERHSVTHMNLAPENVPQ